MIRRRTVKLALNVVRDDDAGKDVGVLAEHGFYVTRLSSTRGFPSMGNTVFLAGTEDGQLEQMLMGCLGEVVRAQDGLLVPG